MYFVNFGYTKKINMSLCLISKGNTRKDELFYHPRLTYMELEDEGESDESYDQRSRSDGSNSPRPSRPSSTASSCADSPDSPRRRPGPKKLSSITFASSRKPERGSERMFDDSDDDSPAEKEGRNLNWTQVVAPSAIAATNATRRRGAPAGNKDPPPPSGQGLVSLGTTAPSVPENATAVDGSSAAAPLSQSTQQGLYVARIRLLSGFLISLCIDDYQ